MNYFGDFYRIIYTKSRLIRKIDHLFCFKFYTVNLAKRALKITTNFSKQHESVL